MTIRVLLVDDQTLLRATFRLLIDSTSDLTVVGEAANGQDAITMARDQRPDVVLMDIRMPVLDGIAATRQIAATNDLHHVKIIMLTTFETDDLILDALRAGASGYLGKGVEPQTLLDAIRSVAAGDSLLSPTATRSLIARVLAQPRAIQARAPAALSRLTPREREILTLVASGLSNDDIAHHLVISPATAKTHVNRTMMKLSARDRAQLVVIAYETSLITPGKTPRAGMPDTSPDQP
jgi:DNA-binding NarL/FixJ family response regulator